MEKRILLVEDNLEISEMVKNHLQKESFTITCAFDGEEALKSFQAGEFDVILLDLMLPKLNGMEVMRRIRQSSLVPILIMSAKDTDVDKAVGLGLGADDYIAKPFSMIELTARINSAIRRAEYYNSSKVVKKNLVIGELEIDPDSYIALKNGEELNLTSKEFEILRLFASNPKKVFTKAQIYSAVWKDDYFGDENVINVHMRRLREKVEAEPSNPKYIKTVWGIGYKLGEF